MINIRELAEAIDNDLPVQVQFVNLGGTLEGEAYRIVLSDDGTQAEVQVDVRSSIFSVPFRDLLEWEVA